MARIHTSTVATQNEEGRSAMKTRPKQTQNMTDRWFTVGILVQIFIFFGWKSVLNLAQVHPEAVRLKQWWGGWPRGQR